MQKDEIEKSRSLMTLSSMTYSVMSVTSFLCPYLCLLWANRNSAHVRRAEGYV